MPVSGSARLFTGNSKGRSRCIRTFPFQRSLLALLAALAGLTACSRLAVPRISFSQSAQALEAYDFVEVTAQLSWPHPQDCFTDATLSGWFETADARKRWQVDGFCDSENGSIYRIRFAPPAPGDYRYFVEYRQGNASGSASGMFHATDGHRRGPIRVDSQYPWHFIWEGTGEHYFFNGTTAYWLMGWRDEKVIQSTIERLHRLKINRIRVTVAGRTDQFYGEPVMVGPNWTTFLTPWPAQSPQDIYHPGFDYTRFHVEYWQKFERMLRLARDRDMIISLVLDMNDGRVHPAPGADEDRFLRYAVARFAAFPNITWDLGDDLDAYRDRIWTRRTGTLLVNWDPYHHLATSHPINNVHQDRTSEWFGFTSFQEWSRDQHTFMLNQRKEQERTGRIIPQTNEEYGYEDHYPLWAPKPDGDSAEVLRRSAWEIVMAGGYQTTGETARRGTNIWPDTGGGWMNGRGDDTMTMLEGYAHRVEFFTSFPWWTTEPHDELVNRGNYCVAKPGEIYAAYLPHGGKATVRLQDGLYQSAWFNPASGQWVALPEVRGALWTSPPAPDQNDWALLLQRKRFSNSRVTDVMTRSAGAHVKDMK